MGLATGLYFQRAQKVDFVGEVHELLRHVVEVAVFV